MDVAVLAEAMRRQASREEVLMRCFPTLSGIWLLAVTGCNGQDEQKKDPPTSDTVAPVLVSVTPVDGAVDVDVATSVVATFSEALDPASVADPALTVSDETGDVAGLVVLDEDTLTFTPDGPLSALTSYAVSLDPMLSDLAGNALGQVGETSFTTAWAASEASVAYLAWGPDNVAIWRADFAGADLVDTVALSEPGWGDIEGLWMSPDGQRVVMLADQDPETQPELELFASSLGGGPTTKVSEPASAGTSFWQVSWSPDSTQIAYIADPEGGGNYIVYLVAADGSGGQTLSTDDVWPYYMSWSPDGTRIAWLRDGDYHLMVAPAAGGTPLDLSGITVATEVGGEPRWSPDSTRMLYGEHRTALYVVDAEGGVATQITPDDPSDVDQFVWKSDTEIIWRGCVACTSETLYRSPAAGGDPVPILTDDAWALSWALSPSGDHVAYYRDAPLGIYVADTNVDAATVSTDWRVSAEGGDTYQGGGDMEDPVWSPDSARVLYRERLTGLDPYQLHVVNRDGSDNIDLSNFDHQNDEVPGWSYGFSPNGNWVLYGAYDLSVLDGLGLIYRSTLDGTDQRVVNDLPDSDAGLFQARDAAGVTPVKFVYYWWSWW
jgi:Tol biopolymer transport system component